jgi:hypothetical protein
VEPQRRLARFLEGEVAAGLGVRQAVPLSGDASDRSYFRLQLGKGSLVLALLPGPFEPDSLPFLNVSRLFERIPVRVPRVETVSGELGILLLEDLGNELLQGVVETASPETKLRLYREAIDILALLQRRGAELESPVYLPYGIAFDEEKLTWELEYFRKHFLEGLRDARLSPSEREELDGVFRRIARELAGEPRVLCHRDYHARNLMVKDGSLVVLDFQDARMGPATYDLVSLLRDSYVPHPAELVEELKRYFWKKSGLAPREAEFELMALQRNLKALGTFGYQIGVRGKEVYRPYIPPTLELVRRNLERHRQWDRLRRVLASHLEELA